MTTTAKEQTSKVENHEVRLYHDDEYGLSLWMPGSPLAWGDAELSGSYFRRDAVSLIELDEPDWPSDFLRLHPEYEVGGEDDVHGNHVISYEVQDRYCDWRDAGFVLRPLPGWYELGLFDYRRSLIGRYLIGEGPAST